MRSCLTHSWRPSLKALKAMLFCSTELTSSEWAHSNNKPISIKHCSLLLSSALAMYKSCSDMKIFFLWNTLPENRTRYLCALPTPPWKLSSLMFYSFVFVLSYSWGLLRVHRADPLRGPTQGRRTPGWQRHRRRRPQDSGSADEVSSAMIDEFKLAFR